MENDDNQNHDRDISSEKRKDKGKGIMIPEDNYEDVEVIKKTKKRRWSTIDEPLDGSSKKKSKQKKRSLRMTLLVCDCLQRVQAEQKKLRGWEKRLEKNSYHRFCKWHPVVTENVVAHKESIMAHIWKLISNQVLMSCMAACREWGRGIPHFNSMIRWKLQLKPEWSRASRIPSPPPPITATKHHDENSSTDDSDSS